MDGNEDLRTRTKRFALQVIRFCAALPTREDANILKRQFLRSGTSVGAHYREACRARSGAEFVSKMEGALQELDETAYWLELLTEAQMTPLNHAAPLLDETDELTRIFVASVRTAKSNL